MSERDAPATTTWYLARTYPPSILAVEVVRETASNVWVRGSGWDRQHQPARRAKRGRFDNYFPTFSEAKRHLVSAACVDVRRAKRQLAVAREALGDAERLTAPSPTDAGEGGGT